MRNANTILELIRERAYGRESLPKASQNGDTGEPCALKVARTVREGAVGKGLSS